MEGANLRGPWAFTIVQREGRDGEPLRVVRETRDPVDIDEGLPSTVIDTVEVLAPRQNLVNRQGPGG